jgi:TolB protein
MNADGSGQHRARVHSSAVWSHDGRWVVFARVGSAAAHDYALHVGVASRDGSHRRQIARFRDEPCFHADWSPDDTRIAYTLGCDADFMDLFVAGRGGHSHLLARGGYAKGAFWAVAPSWSPDGGAILTAAGDKRGTWRLTLLDPDGKARRPIHGSALELGSTPWKFEWSRDGKRILFVDDRQGSRVLYVINRDGSGRRRVSPASLRVFTFDLSPDGAMIAFTGGDGDHRDVYVTSTSGNRIRKLTDGVADLNPAWSPDGLHIAFERVARRTNNPRSLVSQIYVMNADGSDQRNVSRSATSDSEPRWVPVPSN